MPLKQRTATRSVPATGGWYWAKQAEGWGPVFVHPPTESGWGPTVTVASHTVEVQDVGWEWGPEIIPPGDTAEAAEAGEPDPSIFADPQFASGDRLQQVFRIGCQHNRWLVVLPIGVRVPETVEAALPLLMAYQRQKYERPIERIDYIEYLGRG